YWQQYLEMCRKLYPIERFPSGHPDLAQAIHNVGKVLYVLGKPAEALPHLQEALAMRRKMYPDKGADPGYADMSWNLHELGLLHLALGRSQHVFVTLQDSLARQQQQFARLAESAAEAEALQFVDGILSTIDLLLSATKPGQTAAATSTA